MNDGDAGAAAVGAPLAVSRGEREAAGAEGEAAAGGDALPDAEGAPMVNEPPPLSVSAGEGGALPVAARPREPVPLAEAEGAAEAGAGGEGAGEPLRAAEAEAAAAEAVGGCEPPLEGEALPVAALVGVPLPRPAEGVGAPPLAVASAPGEGVAPPEGVAGGDCVRGRGGGGRARGGGGTNGGGGGVVGSTSTDGAVAAVARPALDTASTVSHREAPAGASASSGTNARGQVCAEA